MTGKVLNNRYELFEKVGSGGMADVYKAKCRVLKRWVAVKILKDEFINDEEFLERFEREAYAAGSLNHPNIVSIYDVGREDNIYYIVMEYVDGITLKDYIRQNVRLPWNEAADIAVSILSALHKAHRHNIIHRDIKPQNILMTSDNVPKVTDFGIARASTTATVTRKVDTAGSVHYASPEQARGGYTDEKSDLYSVGVTLFEMLTGTVPFNADNPVTVALKHIEDEPPDVTEYVPEIPKAIDSIIKRAMKKSKAERYDSALQMIADLDHLQKREKMNEDQENQVDPFATKAIEGLEEKALAGKKNNKKDKKVENKANKANNSNKTPKTKTKKYIVISAYVILIGVILGGLWLTYAHVVKPILVDLMAPSTPDVEVKNYVGMNIEEALADLESLDLPYIDPVYEYHDTIEKGTILDQKPAAKIKIKPGKDAYTKVEFVVSNGVEEVLIPEDIKFKDYLEVQILLRDELKLKPKEVAEYNDEVAQGRVIRTKPEIGTSVRVGSEVIIYKSLGPKLKDVPVPDLTGFTMDEAKHTLLSLNLSIGRIFPEGRDGYKGKIINQEPKVGEIIKELEAVNIYFGDEESAVEGTGDGNVIYPGEGRITERIPLPVGFEFGDKIELVVYSTLGDSGQEVLQSRVTVNKSDFPVGVQIPVSPGSTTTIKVYMDGKFQYEKEISID